MTTNTPLARCLAYLEKLPRAVSGSAGHKATFQAVLACRRFGLSQPDTWEALQWFNVHRCDPPWSEQELRHKLASADKVTVEKPLTEGTASRTWRAKVKPVGVLPPIGPRGFTPRVGHLDTPEPEPAAPVAHTIIPGVFDDDTDQWDFAMAGEPLEEYADASEQPDMWEDGAIVDIRELAAYKARHGLRTVRSEWLEGEARPTLYVEAVNGG
jgi:hypothetical protein